MRRVWLPGGGSLGTGGLSRSAVGRIWKSFSSSRPESVTGPSDARHHNVASPRSTEMIRAALGQARRRFGQLDQFGVPLGQRPRLIAGHPYIHAPEPGTGFRYPDAFGMLRTGGRRPPPSLRFGLGRRTSLGIQICPCPSKHLLHLNEITDHGPVSDGLLAG